MNQLDRREAVTALACLPAFSKSFEALGFVRKSGNVTIDLTCEFLPSYEVFAQRAALSFLLYGEIFLDTHMEGSTLKIWALKPSECINQATTEQG